MSLRSNMEHSYRSLAMQTIGQVIEERSKAALAAKPAVGIPSPESLHKLLMAALELADLKKTFLWLQSLDEQLCPEVKDSTENCCDAIREHAPEEGIGPLTNFLDGLFDTTKGNTK